MSSWPVIMTVGLTTPNLLRGTGQLTIAPGLLLCTPKPLTGYFGKAHPLRHQGSRTDIYVAKLLPPWFNVTLPIRADGEMLVASTWILGRRTLRKALDEAGFEVVEHKTWLNRGFDWGWS